MLLLPRLTAARSASTPAATLTAKRQLSGGPKIPGAIAKTDPDRIAVIMAGSGDTISYGDLERRT
ncbi:MAG: hypothetical protein ACRCUI_08255, partial [Polymorphobacter sp.]